MLTLSFLLVCLAPENLHYIHPTKSVKIDPATGLGVQPCENGTYCCYGSRDYGCCSTQSLLFTLGSGPATIKTSFGPEQISKTPTTSTTTSVFSSTNSLVPTFSTLSTSSGGLISPTTSVPTPSSVSPPSNNHVAIGVGIGVGVPVGLALLAGLAYLLRRPSKTSNGRDEIETYLDDGKGPDMNSKVTQEPSEVSGVSMPMELPEQGLVELQHLREHSELVIDSGMR